MWRSCNRCASSFLYVGFRMLAQSCIPGIHPIWSWCLIIFCVAGFGVLILLRLSIAVCIQDTCGLQGKAWLCHEDWCQKMNWRSILSTLVFWHYLDIHVYLGFFGFLIANSVSCYSVTLGFTSLSRSSQLCVWCLLPYWCLLWWVFFLLWFDFLLETVSLCCPNLPWALSPPASASWVGVKAMHHLAVWHQISS